MSNDEPTLERRVQILLIGLNISEGKKIGLKINWVKTLFLELISIRDISRV